MPMHTETAMGVKDIRLKVEEIVEQLPEQLETDPEIVDALEILMDATDNVMTILMEKFPDTQEQLAEAS